MQPFVALLMGSDADLPGAESAISTLRELGIGAEVKVTSAHRTPTHDYLKGSALQEKLARM